MLNFWFQRQVFESSDLYERLGVRLFKRYTPTGGDLMNRWLQRRFAWGTHVTTLHSLESRERWLARTQTFEATHIAFSLLLSCQFIRGVKTRGLTARELAVFLAVQILFNVYPIMLQRYNRLRLRRVVKACRKRFEI